MTGEMIVFPTGTFYLVVKIRGDKEFNVNTFMVG